ncbi:pyridine nucleotide-disulfide oxidoreductase dimerization region [Mycolicibacterium phlei]|uniref:Pyridine nucleotide-disulfide oxidoreductase n=1 Tax=Mycolicibacterium phlei DSM 43239 = CCUG 21000 TaxID=1226750 RepID=A0A5N5V7M0_MYCPH|nr:NAD(P)H-quinone dehydrogenase [Mycolicibacterium phlei]VEG08470.1 pyridine nucleotide-disulfide oxidoreductase dimerization region [Mycobacteroides chelonae]AMO60350.1 NAD(P)H dehydrogenase (quinone) [Mycolicibacterium phlei]KAB7756610.1 pyridine nucleotide-disulfide oxidoreductase [Mycolicibacterium phlei DSM 43239 = CCUG 21000]KXW63497.1 pyridine nucleotide-disulfide oxidoreductase [Mycolicibacterium phlei DSM 43239 = CCUG 21000]KXW78313.1 flavoprotein disulfide reductase [Mycolicibacteri
MATRIVIIGGGPAGYEAALVAASRGPEIADVTVVDSDGIGGACVLYDCVPSKTFIASTGVRTELRRAPDLGYAIEFENAATSLHQINERVKRLAAAQSADIAEQLINAGVTLISGRGELVDEVQGLATHTVKVTGNDGRESTLKADVVLIATGASPRILPGAEPDGERILNWRQLYDLDELPEHLVVVGSGVTGAEFVNAYTELGVKVTVVASRDQILPHEDSDAAAVLENTLISRGVTLVKNARAQSVTRTADGIRVTMADGRTVEGSHALMTVGSVPNTQGLGLERVGVELDDRGYIKVDRVSRTSVPGIYAGGDCTGLMLLASVAAMQGRIAMYHVLGEGLEPIRLRTVAAAVFTRPEIAAVGVPQSAIDDGTVAARTIMLPLNTNARAKMSGLKRGFVKIFCRPATGVVIGGVVVAPIASELIMPIALAVQNGNTVGDLAQTFSVYPSLTGSITEAGRRLMAHDDLD